MDDTYLFIGRVNSLNNSFQAKADMYFEEISWKQVFLLGCIAMFDKPPTIRDISNLAKSTHQNVTQLLSKLVKNGFVYFLPDDTDHRKQRVILTSKAQQFYEQHNESIDQLIKNLFATIDPAELKIALKVIAQLTKAVNSL